MSVTIFYTAFVLVNAFRNQYIWCCRPTCGGTAAAAPPPFRSSDPALCSSSSL